MVDAESRSIIANAGESRTATEWDEIVLDNVSIPVKSIQRTVTSRFEGKVTIGDYTIDSDQLLSTWAQTAWAGGMNIADHIEGATEARFRWAKAWTQTTRALSLPLASVVSSEPAYGAPAAAKRQFFPWGMSNTGTDMRAILPVGNDGSFVYAACGTNVYRWHPLNPTTWTPSGTLADLPYNVGRRFPHPADPTKVGIFVPLGESGYQVIDPATDTVNAVSTAVTPLAFEVHDNRLYALERNVWNTVSASTSGGGQLRWLDATGTWSAVSPTRAFPVDDAPLDLRLWYDRSGNKRIIIITDKKVWFYDEDADAVVPLGLGPDTMTDLDPYAIATWRDDGLYIGKAMGIVRMSTAGVITFMGLDRDDGYSGGVSVYQYINELIPGVNGLYAYVTSNSNHTRDLLAWNEAGWHFISRQEFPGYTGTIDPLPTRSIVINDAGQEVIVTGVYAKAGSGAPTDYSLNLTATYLPAGNHAPRLGTRGWNIEYDPDGEYLSGWFDAGMMNFLKAWSHAEVYLRDPDDGSTTPPGTVTVSYRTERDVANWITLGTTTTYGRNVFTMPGAGSEAGVTSLKIELRLQIADTTGANPLRQTPIIEGTVLKFQKIAQYGSAWQVYVPLSDFLPDHRGNGPRQIDDFLSRLTSQGSEFGPFQTMIHGRNHDGTPATYRVRVSQWQRSEQTGEVPYGDGVLSLIAVDIPQIEGA